MTTAELIENFSILQDKRGSSSFDEDEVLKFLNLAQLERLKRLLPDDQGGVVNLDLDSNTLMNLRPLIYPISTTMNSSGLVTFSAITTALRTASSDSGCSLHRILGMTLTSSGKPYPIKYTRLNNWDSYKRNVFKAGSTTAPRFKVDATNITIDPAITTATVGITCLKTPKTLTADNTPEFDDYNLSLIVEIALQYAAQSTRDFELIQTIHNTKVSQ
jgi:hypothetical protein